MQTQQIEKKNCRKIAICQRGEKATEKFSCVKERKKNYWQSVKASKKRKQHCWQCVMCQKHIKQKDEAVGNVSYIKWKILSNWKMKFRKNFIAFFLIFVKMGDVFSILRMMLDKAFLHLMIAAPFFFFILKFTNMKYKKS